MSSPNSNVSCAAVFGAVVLVLLLLVLLGWLVAAALGS